MSRAYLRNLTNRRHFILLASSTALGSAIGCSFRRPYDGQAVDLKGRNLCDPDEQECDMAVSPVRDMAQPRDLAQPPDLSQPRDLAGQDLAGADLSMQPPDLAQAPDLAQPPDLAPTCSGTVIPVGMQPPVNGVVALTDREGTAGSYLCQDAEGFYCVWRACQHAGCQTTFSQATRTFNCPCHGSRYNYDGTVAQGPTISGMKFRAVCRNNRGELVVDLEYSPPPYFNPRTRVK